MPSRPRLSASEEHRSAVWPGALTALWACGVGWLAVAALVLVAGAWGDASVPGIVRGTARTWLVGQGAGVSVDGVAVTLVPWGGVLVAAALVAWVARRQSREPVSEPAAFVATTAGVYAVAASVVVPIANTGGVAIPTVRAALVTFVLAGLSSAAGYASVHGIPDSWLPAQRHYVSALLRAAGVTVTGVLVSAFVLVAVLLTLHIDQAGSLWAMLDPGLGGGVILAFVCVLAVPTLVLWAVAVLLGPGIQLGTDTSLDLTSSHLGQVPGLPVLAALPAPGDFPGWTFLLGLIPAIAAGYAGWWLVRRGEVVLEDNLWNGAALAGLAGALGGVLLALCAAVSTGSLGPGRMSDVGPESWWPLLSATPFMAVAAALGALAAHYRGARATAE